MNVTALIVFLLLFALVTIVGFLSSRWKQGDLDLLDEWGLGGRRFGTLITWFLLGGDLYTAYTFVAVPALVYGAGAIGYFAVPYTIVVFPIMYLIMPRLWSVSKTHNYVTPADFVKGRYASRSLSLAVAVTGIVATMPYIALQLLGIEVVLEALGFPATGPMKDLPLIVAFAILAFYTYFSGLRAPALTAVVKDLLIYITVIAAIIVIPMKLGGYGAIFHAASITLPTRTTPGALILSPKAFSAFSTLALGSAFALLLYPHVVTGTLSAASARTVRRNAALLPMYSIALFFIATLGYMAIAAHIQTKVPDMVVPLLFLKMFPAWFVGVAFAAIAIGALVPASIMSIAAANLFSRNIYREFVNPNATPQQESKIAKLASLVVKLGAIIFIVAVPLKYSIYLQTLGGIWILQTMPAIVIGLYSSWFHRRALLVGWFIGMVTGTWMAAAEKFASSVYPLTLFGHVIPAYAAIWSVLLNFIVTIVLTVVFRGTGMSAGQDETSPEDYRDTRRLGVAK